MTGRGVDNKNRQLVRFRLQKKNGAESLTRDHIFSFCDELKGGTSGGRSINKSHCDGPEMNKVGCGRHRSAANRHLIAVAS